MNRKTKKAIKEFIQLVLAGGLTGIIMMLLIVL